MTYFNLELSTLRAAEFLGSEPVARATWLCVVAYCIDQENDGRIVNCREWKDRQWQQTCGVTLEEVNGSAPLLNWEGSDLVVWKYPLAHQTKWQRNRVAARAGGRSKSEAKVQAARINGAKHNPSTTEAEPNHNPSTTQAEPKQQPNIKEDKIREDKIKEERASPSTPRTPTLQQWLEHATQTHADWPQSDATSAWEHYESLGWMKRKTPIQRWRSCLETCYRNWVGRNIPQSESVEQFVARMNQPIFPGYRA